MSSKTIGKSHLTLSLIDVLPFIVARRLTRFPEEKEHVEQIMQAAQDSIVTHFFVPGIPKSGGSKTAFPNPKTGKNRIVDACKGNAAWKKTVGIYAAMAYGGPPLSCPLGAIVVFTMPRPRKHFRTGKFSHLLKPDAPYWVAQTPDLTKLWRPTEDAMKGIVFDDDSRICRDQKDEIFGPEPGVEILIYRLPIITPTA